MRSVVGQFIVFYLISSMVDYHKIKFGLHLDDRHEHAGVLSLYRREVYTSFDVGFWDATRTFLAMIVNLSYHAHRIGHIEGMLARGITTSFILPQVPSVGCSIDPQRHIVFRMPARISDSVYTGCARAGKFSSLCSHGNKRRAHAMAFAHVVRNTGWCL